MASGNGRSTYGVQRRGERIIPSAPRPGQESAPLRAGRVDPGSWTIRGARRSREFACGAGRHYRGRMCTLILGLEVVAPHTLLLGANRDEDPARPSDPPAVLSTDPPVAGGRDRVAGGTWLAVRGRDTVIAM